MNSISHMPFAGGRLTIDLGALVQNYNLIAARVSPSRASAVIKADGYGLGADHVVSALRSAGCETFFVAHLSEALHLRARYLDCQFIVLNGLPAGAEQTCADAGCIPVINSFDQLERWNAQGLAMGRALPAAIQIDSGMSRLGLSHTETRLIASAPGSYRGLDIHLVMSHLACADDPEAEATEIQRVRFDTLADLLPPRARSLANSGGIFGSIDLHYDLVRPGIALYGGAPQQHSANPMRPVVRLEALIIQVRTVLPGTGVGYGLTYVANSQRRLATLSVGYADGWPRHLGNKGSAFVKGVRVPIVGRVSMDSMIVDVTDVDEAFVSPGDWVELIGEHQSIDDVATDAGTIAYEILTQLGARYERIYITPPETTLMERIGS